MEPYYNIPPKFKVGDAVMLKPFKSECSYCEPTAGSTCDTRLNYIWISKFNNMVNKLMYVERVDKKTPGNWCPKHTYRLRDSAGKTYIWGFNEIWLESASFLEDLSASFLDDNLFEI